MASRVLLVVRSPLICKMFFPGDVSASRQAKRSQGPGHPRWGDANGTSRLAAAQASRNEGRHPSFCQFQCPAGSSSRGTAASSARV